MSILLETAHTAIRLYAETHPRPPHVTNLQAAEMLGLNRNTITRLIKSGELGLNSCGMIPITEIDRVIAARKLCQK